MSVPSPSLRRFVRRALVDTTGVAQPDRAQLAFAFETLCQRLRQRLQPLFGSAAVSALFVRSVHVAAAEYPWLGEIAARSKDSCSLEGIATLESLAVDTLNDSLAAVLAHNIGLLSAFVGEDLVLPLVQQAWGVGGAPGSEGDQ
jgi:hypothetical protein